MLQFIWKHFPRTRATFTLINRTSSVRLGEIVGVAQLREQLEATRQLRFRKSELVWLAGNTLLRPPRHLRARLPRLAGARFPALRLRALRPRRPVAAPLRGPLVGNVDVGDLRARPDRRTEDARRAQAFERTRTRHSLRARQDPALGKDGAPARRSRSEHQRLRHPPQAQLSLARVRRQRHARHHRRELHRHLQRLPRLQARS